MNIKMMILVLLVLIAAAGSAQGDELHLLGGLMWKTDTDDSSYSWQLEFRQGVTEHYAWSFSYLNEGHVPVHHRDGNSLQFWTRTNLLDRRLSLAVGAGPYHYFDTTKAISGESYENIHGWGIMTSAAATWYTESRWLFQLRTNWVETFHSIDTVSTLVGIGYQLDPPESPGPRSFPLPRQQNTTGNEVTAFLGRTIVNSFGSEHSTAVSVEYRRGLWRYVDWTVAWLHEGDNRLIRRNGITSQFWGTRAFFAEQLTLGIGAGAYIAIDRYSSPLYGANGSENLSGIVTMSASYRFDPHWGVRTSWNRVVTNYNKDTDVILAGIGYRF